MEWTAELHRLQAGRQQPDIQRAVEEKATGKMNKKRNDSHAGLRHV